MTKAVLQIICICLAAQTIFAQEINWPAAYEPSESSFYVHNEIEINASPEVVWKILIDAERWPEWYEGAFNVKLVDTTAQSITANSSFTWKTMGIKFRSDIKEFEAPYRLSWESKKKSICGYHAWLIIPTTQGCKVITDESQHGWLTFMEKIFQPKKLRRLHDKWLQELKKLAELAEEEPNYN